MAGPCSAESEEQLRAVALALKAKGIDYMRAGVWKPRTRPLGFEGKGLEALEWLSRVKQETGIKIATEVSHPDHIELALRYGIDVLWLGARTTVNPFLVQELADALRGTTVPVLVKNPVNPDTMLWLGAIERVALSGQRPLGAVHRGFSVYEASRYRNPPLWQIAIELRRQLPDLQLLADPSHIAGKRSLVAALAQEALDLDYDGLMIEVHPDPPNAWSDSAQQLTVDEFNNLVDSLLVKSAISTDVEFLNKLEQLRSKIDRIDKEMVKIIAERMKLVDEIGTYKRDNHVTVFQKERWSEIFSTRTDWAKMLELNPALVADIYRLIHDESIKRQTAIVNEAEKSVG